MLRTAVMLLTCTVAFQAASLQAQPKQRTIDFNRDVRPILSENCFQCHGPDKNKLEAELRLDRKEGLFRNADGTIVVVPGKPAKSELIARVTATDDSLRMPPADSGRKLTPKQIAVLRKWVEQGAECNGHWAYLRPARSKSPNAGKGSFARNEIDRFILAGLKHQGMRPSSEADRATLIRRLSFDLIGLPPSQNELQAFVNDKSPQAYERLMDRLLASPHFGERLAMYWLDMVRFADTNGYHGDNHRNVTLYRDYVINAFNDNLPFDRFTVEQLAGDLLPNATRDQKIASGYNRLLMTTREGGAQAKEYLAKYSADRVRNVAGVWLGATFGCAECHDHKYDPFTMKDFYSFASFFADLQETAVGTQPPTRLPTAEQAAKIAALDQQIAGLKKTLNLQTSELDAAQVKWEESVRNRKIEWTVLKPAELSSKNGTPFEQLEDGSIRAMGTGPERDVYTVVTNAALKGVTGLKLEVLPDDSFPSRGPGRAGNGNFVLNELKATAGGKPLKFGDVFATYSQLKYAVNFIVDGKPKTGWAILEKAGMPIEAVLETKTDVGAGKETNLKIELHQNYGSRHTIGRFRLSVTNAARPLRGLPKQILTIVEIDPSKRTEQQQRMLSAHYRTIAPLLVPTRKQIVEFEKKKGAFTARTPTMLISTAVKPRTMRVLARGNWLDDSGEVVTPAVPEFLGNLGLKDRRATRLDLAKWMVDPSNPIVARVFVNRLWKVAFGRGLVKSLDDFGSQGAQPTHPELLDWLAVEFAENGWDVKRMLKLMVMSAAYRQSSIANEELRKRDPYNQWLARQSQFRLDAETIRDNALAVSGLLVPKVGGVSVKPYQPAGYWAHLNFPKRVYKHDNGESQYRRGLYTYWCRTFLHPSLRAFDASTREECAVERPRSNTPVQALVLLNDPTYVEAARALAEKMIRNGGAEEAKRIRFVFQQVLSRDPVAAETKLLADLYEKHHGQFQKERMSAELFLSIGQRPVPDDLDKAELAAWTSVARVILNLHETITRY